MRDKSSQDMWKDNKDMPRNSDWKLEITIENLVNVAQGEPWIWGREVGVLVAQLQNQDLWLWSESSANGKGLGLEEEGGSSCPFNAFGKSAVALLFVSSENMKKH